MEFNFDQIITDTFNKLTNDISAKINSEFTLPEHSQALESATDHSNNHKICDQEAFLNNDAEVKQMTEDLTHIVSKSVSSIFEEMFKKNSDKHYMGKNKVSAGAKSKYRNKSHQLHKISNTNQDIIEEESEEEVSPASSPKHIFTSINSQPNTLLNINKLFATNNIDMLQSNKSDIVLTDRTHKSISTQKTAAKRNNTQSIDKKKNQKSLSKDSKPKSSQDFYKPTAKINSIHLTKKEISHNKIQASAQTPLHFSSMFGNNKEPENSNGSVFYKGSNYKSIPNQVPINQNIALKSTTYFPKKTNFSNRISNPSPSRQAASKELKESFKSSLQSTFSSTFASPRQINAGQKNHRSYFEKIEKMHQAEILKRKSDLEALKKLTLIYKSQTFKGSTRNEIMRNGSPNNRQFSQFEGSYSTVLKNVKSQDERKAKKTTYQDINERKNQHLSSSIDKTKNRGPNMSLSSNSFYSPKRFVTKTQAMHFRKF